MSRFNITTKFNDTTISVDHKFWWLPRSTTFTSKNSLIFLAVYIKLYPLMVIG